MKRYEIICTPEQTRKALKLGAPIDNITHYASYGKNYISGNNIYDNGVCYFVPTAEQMICWLEEQEGIIGICIRRDFSWFYQVSTKDASSILSKSFSSRKEATIAAIDAALEYLNNNKK